MIVSYKWLREFVDLPDKPDELAEIMTFGGIEVENIVHSAEHLKRVTIVKIVKVRKHPNSDKLHIATVDTGSSQRDIVCGAPNCREGIITAYAPAGIQLCGINISKVSIRGVESEGMLCSEKELGISDNHDGIIELPDNVPLGQSIDRLLDLSDTLFEVEITPNRPDLLGVLGIARDIAALTAKELVTPKGFPTDGIKYPKGVLETLSAKECQFELINETPVCCPRYIARIIKGVKISESPDWLRRRLIASDIKPVNSIVDITNYVMLEFGHPLHAFDYDKLAGREVRIRRAVNGETIAALDNRTYTLSDNDLVIADHSNPVAIAGIIGGTASSITDSTETIVLEAANFDNLLIRKTVAKLKISTDSSYRFERNLSDETLSLISQRAADLICQICGGEVVHLVDSYPSPGKETSVSLRTKRVNELLTTDLSSVEMENLLRSLGLSLSSSESVDSEKGTDSTLTFSVPPYRKDLTREIDLIEEIIRLYGYNNIPEQEERESLTNQSWFQIKRKTADYLVYNGFSEAINSSFVEQAFLKQLKLPEGDYRNNCFELINPLGASFSKMRTTLIPGLLKNTQFNIHNGQSNLKLFELGKVYLKSVDKQPSNNSIEQTACLPSEERYHLTGIVSGKEREDHWQHRSTSVDIFLLKGYIEGLLSLLTANRIEFRPFATTYYQKGLALEVVINDHVMGNLGKIDPLISKELEIEQSLFLFDIDIDTVIQSGEMKTGQYQEINRFPSMSRDISFIIDNRYTHKEIENSIRLTESDIVIKVKLIDEFKGKNIPAGHRSLTYNILFSSSENTLTDETVNRLLNILLTRLKKDYSIEMR